MGDSSLMDTTKSKASSVSTSNGTCKVDTTKSKESSVSTSNGTCKVVEAERHQLEDEAGSRLKILLQGPFLQHSRLVRCADVLKGDNSWSPTTDRFWSISPQQRLQSKVCDTLAVFLWIMFVIYPAVAITMGSCYRNLCNVVNAIVLCVVMIYFLMCFYVILKNNKKFRRLWFVIKADTETCDGYRNQVSIVTRETVNKLTFLTLQKKREVDLILAQNPHQTAVIMVCSKSFWKVNFLDPNLCLVGLILVYTASVIVQLEMLNISLL